MCLKENLCHGYISFKHQMIYLSRYDTLQTLTSDFNKILHIKEIRNMKVLCGNCKTDYYIKSPL